MITRIAMWSGPRNISTAMMRAWENRADTIVVDEPFYAAYLAETGLEHPMREEVLASQPNDWCAVAQAICLETPAEPTCRILYQKHMTHHLLPSMGRDWLDGLTHAFLIREPKQVIASYVKKRGDVGIHDLGYPQQAEIFTRIADRRGAAPPVVLASDVLKDPRGTLRRLCDALSVPFSEQMLAWPAGRRASDGVWAPHWYAAVEASTGFAPYVDKRVEVPSHLEALEKACRPYFEQLYPYRLGPTA